MKKRFFVVAAIMIGSQLQAQEDSTKMLDEVIVTSNKFPKKQSETGKVVTVITRQDIEKSGGKTLGELLNTTPGTTIIGANNSPGTNQTISIRGASAGNVLILLDGIPVNDPSVISNYFDLNFISLDQVERIEVLKGGHSTLYGSDAVAGVVNIISKKAIEIKFGVSGSLTAGSYNTMKQNLGIGGSTGKFRYALDYTHLSSDGFSAAHDSTNSGYFDKDGISQHTIGGRIGLRFAKKWDIAAFTHYSKYTTDLDYAAFNDDRDYRVDNNNIHSGLGIAFTHSRGKAQFNYSYNQTDRDYKDDSVHKSNPFAYFTRSSYTGRTHFAELYSNWKCNMIEFLAGIDYRLNNTDQSYFSFGMFGPYSAEDLSAEMNQVSVYTSVIYKKGDFTGEAGGRWNRHSEYGSNFTVTLNPSYQLNKKIKLFANFYSAFKTPTLFQLFDPFAGNPSLQPEHGLIGEIGIAINEGPFYTRLTGFYRKTDYAIVYTYDPGTFTSKYLNASNQTNYGAEWEGSYTKEKWTVKANYTYTNGRTTTPYDGTGVPIGKDTTYYNLYRIPEHAINLDAGYQINKNLFLSARVHAVSKREEFIYGSSPLTLDSYATIDLFAEYKFNKPIRLFLDLRNITNKEYFDFVGYNTRKFNVTGGVAFSL